MAKSQQNPEVSSLPRTLLVAALFFPLLTAGGRRAEGHPVAYKGAWSFMAFNQPDMLDWQLLYTFSRNLSFGVDGLRDTMEGPERYFLIPRVSWLVKRWNGRESQANVYVYGGVGAALRGSDSALAAEGAIEADYETRRFYVSGKWTGVFARGFESLHVSQFRIGLAPYAAGFEELSTWLILQVQHVPSAPDSPIRIGPVMRFFYKNVLWEIGVTTRSLWNLNFMVHF